MKKYFLKSNDKELEFGDTIRISMKTQTKDTKETFGAVIKFTKKLAEMLVKEGIVYIKETQDEKSDEKDGLPVDTDRLTNILNAFCKRHDMPAKKTSVMFASVLSTSQLAHLTLLIEEMAREKNKGKVLSQGWYLNPTLRWRPSIYVGDSSGIPLFKEHEDALDVYNFLKPFIDMLIETNGKQED